jgi:homoserine kinase type II
MAVYTHITETQLGEFLARYDLGALKRYEGIRQGVENTNYHLYTTAGHFILTLFEKRVSPVDLPFFFAFTDHLARRGVLCPRALPDKEGRPIGMLAGKPAAIITFMEGRDVAAADITPSHCYAVGQLAAQMHVASYDFTFNRPNNLGLGGWKTLAVETMGQADMVIPTLGRIIVDEIEYLESVWPEKLPGGVVHADLFPDNVLFDGNDIGGVIDFYFSCSDFYAYDLAIIVNAWCFDEAGVFLRTRFDAMMKGYESVRSLDFYERLVFPDLLRGAALRFMLTRLYDWINRDPQAVVTVKEPHEYFAKLIFHQNERIAL